LYAADRPVDWDDCSVLIVIIIRVLTGLEAWNAEPVLVGGAIVGVATFMYATGIMNDWIKWAKGIGTPDISHEDHGPRGFARY